MNWNRWVIVNRLYRVGDDYILKKFALRRRNIYEVEGAGKNSFVIVTNSCDRILCEGDMVKFVTDLEASGEEE